MHGGIKVDTLGRIKVHERTTKKVPAEKGQEDGTQRRERGGREEREGCKLIECFDASRWTLTNGSKGSCIA